MELESGVRGVLEFSGKMSPTERVGRIYNICYEIFLSKKLETLQSRGKRLNFEVGHRIEQSETETVIYLTTFHFSLEMSMDTEAREIFIEDTPETIIIGNIKRKNQNSSAKGLTT